MALQRAKTRSLEVWTESMVYNPVGPRKFMIHLFYVFSQGRRTCFVLQLSENRDVIKICIPLKRKTLFQSFALAGRFI